MRCALLNDTGSRGNWGSRATSEELLGELKSVFGDGLQIERFPLRKSTWRDAVAGKLGKGFILRGLAAGGSGLRGVTQFLEQRELERLAACDFAVFQSEGTMDGLRFTTAERLLLLPAYAACELGMPVLALNGSAESLSPGFEQALAGVYRRFQLVQMREPRSQQYLSKLGLNGVGLNPDSAFLATPEPIERPFPWPYLCLTGSAVIRKSPWEPYAHCVLSAAAQHGLGVVLLCSGPGDLKTLGTLPETANLVKLPLSCSYRQVAEVLRQSEILVGGRYHMQILASTVGTPLVFTPSGSHKTEGLLALLEDPQKVIDPADEGTLRTRIAAALASREAESERLLNRVAAIRAMKANARGAWSHAVKKDKSSPGAKS